MRHAGLLSTNYARVLSSIIMTFMTLNFGLVGNRISQFIYFDFTHGSGSFCSYAYKDMSGGLIAAIGEFKQT